MLTSNLFFLFVLVLRLHLDFCFFFFFSSRRRHTRWPRDWSSDVCSSDLTFQYQLMSLGALYQSSSQDEHGFFAAEEQMRSEERRVGKECRSWWWKAH